MHHRPCVILKPNIPVISWPQVGVVQRLECRCKKTVGRDIDPDILPGRSMPRLSSAIEIQPALANGRTHKFEVAAARGRFAHRLEIAKPAPPRVDLSIRAPPMVTRFPNLNTRGAKPGLE